MPFRPPRRVLLSASVALAAALAGAPAASAATCDRVAARDGSDANAGTLAAPFKTAQKLANSLLAGQTGCLRAGTYDEQGGTQYVLRVNRPDIALRSYPGERATLKGIVFVPQGSDRVKLTDLDFDGRQSTVTAAPPVSVKIMAADVSFERNDVTNHRVKSCVILGSNGGWGQAQRTVIRLNRFHDCGDPAHGALDHAIYFENTVDVQVTDNVFTGTSAFAIHLYPNADRTYIARNVIDGNARGVIFAGDSTLASDSNVVERNLITNSYSGYNAEHYWERPKGSGNVLRMNCVVNGRLGNLESQDGWSAAENLVADPQYVDRAAGDLRLRPTSPCLAVVGQDTAAEVQEALTGVAPPPVLSEPAPEAPAPAPVAPAPVPVAPAPAPAPTTTEPAPATQPAPVPGATPRSKSKRTKRASSSSKARRRKAAARKRKARRSARRAAGRR